MADELSPRSELRRTELRRRRQQRRRVVLVAFVVVLLIVGAAAYVAEMPSLFSTLAVVGGGFGAACSVSSRVATKTPAAATISRTTRKATRTTRRRC